MSPILFCNIGWMKNYAGSRDDRVVRGGSFNKHSVGHEICNFAAASGSYYGYVQPVGKQIKIERLGASVKDECIHGVTVVWIAGAELGGTYIVGWYENATVYRYFQKFGKSPRRQTIEGIDGYWIKAATKNAKLLSHKNRSFEIPRNKKGGIGHSNVWYAQEPESAGLVKKVRSMISSSIINDSTLDNDFEDEVYGVEGARKLSTHLRRERDVKLIKQKKASALRTKNGLGCEACGFSFSAFYGNLASDFCEVHHINPLHKSNGEVQTKLSDLAILCSNCHRVIHRSNPMISVAKLAKLIRKIST